MKRTLKQMVGVLLALVVVFGMTGCGKKLDPAAYVQAELDLLTKADVDQYAKQFRISKEEAIEVYEDIIDDMDITEQITQDVELPEDVEDGFEKWFIDVLSKTKYTIMETQEVEDGYIVIVAVEPIKAFDGAQETLETKSKEYMTQLMEKVAEGETVDEDQVNADVFKMMLEILNDILDSVTYGDKVEVETKIVREADGEYEIDEASFEKLGESLIDVTGLDN